MEKIAEINLAGLSPQTVMDHGGPPEPMDTPGAAKAKAIMARADEVNAELSKTSAVRRPNKEEASSYLSAALQGAGAGTAVTKLLRENPSLKHHRTGAGIGAALMMAQAALKNSRIHQTKTASTPAMALKASQQVGKFANKIHAGPAPSKSIPTIRF